MENEKLIAKAKSSIYTIRSVAVMLDKDLATLYGVSTSRLNEQVRRNISRFPPSFCFQLNKNELMEWMSQNAISKSERMGMRKCPFVFTEYGAAMVSSVLKSTIAVEVSIQIIQGFIDFKAASCRGEVLVSRLSSIERLLLSHDSQIQDIYQKMKDVEFPKSGIFFNDQIFDAYVFSSELIKSAKQSVVLIDNYVDEVTLLQLSKRRHGVACIIYTEKISSTLRLDLDKHNAQFPTIQVAPLKNVHDRFLILDDDQLYHMGASLKDLGKRWFAFSRIDGLLAEIQSRLK